MSLIKCPRCELNYMNDTDTMCSVCRREVRGESEQFDILEMCSECGEHPAVPGQELCVFCLKERSRRNETVPDEIKPTASIEIDSVATMDEIELDLNADLDGEVFDEDEDFSDDDDDDDKEDEEE